MAFPMASRYADKHDVVLVGYRGVEGSAKLDCPEVTSAREQARGYLTEEGDAGRRCGDQGAQSGSRTLDSTSSGTLPQRVDDLDAARKALVRARRPPQRERRDADGDDLRLAVSAARSPLGDDRRQPPRQLPLGRRTTGEQIRRYATLCASASCRSRTPDLAASIRSAYARCPTTGGSCRSGRATSARRSSASCTRPPTARGRSTARTIDSAPPRRRRSETAVRGSCRS